MKPGSFLWGEARRDKARRGETMLMGVGSFKFDWINRAWELDPSLFEVGRLCSVIRRASFDHYNGFLLRFLRRGWPNDLFHL